MGKLNIAHHKSYHPYRADNIARVRADEEAAALLEAQADGKMRLADGEARLELLRQRAGLDKNKNKEKRRREGTVEEIERVRKEISEREGKAIGLGGGGHINFFEEMEKPLVPNPVVSKALSTANKGKGREDTGETDKGFPLAPSLKDRNPWYASRPTDPGAEEPEEDGKDEKSLWGKKESKASKASMILHDPLTTINSTLERHKRLTNAIAFRERSSYSHSHSSSRPRSSSSSNPSNPVEARQSRESSERQRALDLIARKKREMQGMMTPSTVAGDDRDGGYRDVFNRVEVEEAGRRRGRRW